MIPQLELFGQYEVVEATIRHPYIKIKTPQGDYWFSISRFRVIHTEEEKKQIEEAQNKRAKEMNEMIKNNIKKSMEKKQKKRRNTLGSLNRRS